jgi:hypothetical protein
VNIPRGTLAWFVASVWLALTPLPAQEQTDVAPPPSARFPAAWYPLDNDVSYTMAPVKGAPYEARLVMNGGPAGVPLAQAPLYARDSAGRTRTETIEHRVRDGKPVEARNVEVGDSVSHCTFHWLEPWLDKNAPTATVSCMTRTLHYNAQPNWSSILASTQVSEEHPSSTETDRNEELGVRTVDGMRAVGVRRTRMIRATGSESARTLVIDFWVSTEMKEVVAMRTPPNGYTLELREIKLREPDRKLFYPPANYKIAPVSNQP